MRKPLAIGAATLAVVLSLGLTACGSDDSDDTLSNSDLIAQANAICSDYDEQLNTLIDDSTVNDDSSNEEVAAFIGDDLVPLFESQIDELRALNPNEDDAETYNDIIDTLESEVQTVADDPEASVAADNPFAGSSAKAQEFGLDDCGAE